MLVFKWLEHFKDRRESVYDDERCGRADTVGESLTAKVKEFSLINEPPQIGNFRNTIR